MLSDKPVVFSAKRISKDFGAGKSLKTAVKDVSFDIYDEEFISIVGGSGCGKSVLAKIMLGLYKPTRGQFLYRDKPIKNLKAHWNEVQSVFQDPFGCFNQFFTIRSQLEDALNILKDKPSKEEVRRRVDEGLMAVNVKPEDIEGKYPFELSGGQMQRMLLARIFALRPKVLIADEATSMVDACVRANILDYLRNKCSTTRLNRTRSSCSTIFRKSTRPNGSRTATVLRRANSQHPLKRKPQRNPLRLSL